MVFIKHTHTGGRREKNRNLSRHSCVAFVTPNKYEGGNKNKKGKINKTKPYTRHNKRRHPTAIYIEWIWAFDDTLWGC